MPNIVGGDQHHPSYDPRVPLGENEVLVGTNLYEIKNISNGKTEVWMQGVKETEARPCSEQFIPKEVKERIEQLKNKQ